MNSPSRATFPSKFLGYEMVDVGKVRMPKLWADYFDVRAVEMNATAAGVVRFALEHHAGGKDTLQQMVDKSGLSYRAYALKMLPRLFPDLPEVPAELLNYRKPRAINHSRVPKEPPQLKPTQAVVTLDPQVMTLVQRLARNTGMNVANYLSHVLNGTYQKKLVGQ